MDVAALAQERCVSVGARDRTARLWKVAEETQLVFRGGGGGGGTKCNEADNKKPPGSLRKYAEGSIDRIAMIDEETFITGSDNGSISLWTTQKKKPIFTISIAHGLEPPLSPEEHSAEINPDPNIPPPEPQPRWITALATVPYSDLVVSGSWDGNVRVWKVSGDKKRIEAAGVLGRHAGAEGKGNVKDGAAGEVKGVVNDLGVFERGERGKDGICVVVGLGAEHRFGRWNVVKGKNGAVVFEVPTLNNSETAGKVEEAGDEAPEDSYR